MNQFDNMLHVVEDPSSEKPTSVARVVSLAENNQARLTVLHVAAMPRLGPFAGSLEDEDVRSRLKQQKLGMLDALLKPYHARVQAAIEVQFGTPFVEIVRDVLLNRCDLVTKAAGYGGAHRFLFGGTDQHLLRKCPCPVWIMHRETSTNYARVLATVDFDPWEQQEEESGLIRRIIDLAGSVALSDFAELHVVHAWEPIADNMIRVFRSELSENQVAANIDLERRGHQDHLQSLGSDLCAAIGDETYHYLSPRRHLSKGNPRVVIPAIASELHADLVVMGTVGRSGIPGFLIGNTAEVIVNNLDCSVLAVKPSGFVSPIHLS